MATIYLSSTYEDLKDYRRAVFEALRKSGHQVIAMEDYVATDQRPVQKCLDDVAKADPYVGLLAFRYGYVPPCPFYKFIAIETFEHFRYQQGWMSFLTIRAKLLKVLTNH